MHYIKVLKADKIMERQKFRKRGAILINKLTKEE